ncbi:hypothetical protein ACU5B6_18720 [Moritella viscosa]|uniref:hypothetical protein n=1 Tax=Moritella viscosa TaxID=80854 RepID=UPI000923C4A9|nr:hypothetical protein [Moritella viscosa]SHO07913.1 Putative Holliday junction resolvase [Moritella viscosa]SHO07941.1 Putative Holliday junction resolvase [Moritella viscosa]SHO16172.1 Putative Holliday junction resolvase [Moritella viscosa]
MKKLILSFLLLVSSSVSAYNFENVSCSIILGKDGKSAIGGSTLKINTVKNINSSEIDINHWKQDSVSNKFILVEVNTPKYPTSKQVFRIVNGELHTTFESKGERLFRRIVINDDMTGFWEMVTIQGSTLRSTIVNTLKCEKNLFM